MPPPNKARLLALALEAKQALTSLRIAYAEGVLTREALARAVGRMTSLKSRGLAIHTEFETAGRLASSELAEARRQFGAVWSSVRDMEAAVQLACRNLGVDRPRRTRIDTTWNAVKSKFVSGWPRTNLPPLVTVPRDPELAAEPTHDTTGPDGARCPVCSDALDERVIQCANCEAYHHAECWSYAGGCAIFGCKKRRR